MKYNNLTTTQINRYREKLNIQLTDIQLNTLKAIAAQKNENAYREDIAEYLYTANLITESERDELNAKGRITVKCFFHEDSKPSMSIYTKLHADNKYSFICCACCGIINFYNLRQVIEGAYNRAAYVTRIAEQNNSNECTQQVNLTDNALTVYNKKLFDNSVESNQVLEYLVGRGVNKKSIELHQIGLAVNNNLRKFIKNSEIESYKTVGLLNDYSYDFLNGRLTMRYSDNGAAGRTLPFIDCYHPQGQEPCKYLNLKNSECFDKSKELFNFNNINKTDCIYLVEGYFDAIALTQYHLNQSKPIQAAAAITCNLSLEQAKLLKTKTDKIVLSLDSDTYGQKNTITAIRHLIEAGFNINNIFVLTLTDDKDFADFFINRAIICNSLDNTEYNVELVEQVLNSYIPAVGFIFARLGALYANDDISYAEYKEGFKMALNEFVDITEYATYLQLFQNEKTIELKQEEKEETFETIINQEATIEEQKGEAMATKLYDPFQDTLAEVVIIYDMKTVIEAERLAVASKVLYFLKNNQGTSGVNAVNNYIWTMLGEKKYYSYLKILEDFNEEIKKFKTVYYIKEDTDRLEAFNKVDVFNFIYENVNHLQYLVTTRQGGCN